MCGSVRNPLPSSSGCLCVCSNHSSGACLHQVWSSSFHTPHLRWPLSLPFSLSSCSPWPWLAAALVLIRAAHPFLTSRQLTRFQRGVGGGGGGGWVTLFLHIPLMCLLTFPPCPQDALLSPMCCLIVGPRRSRVIRHCHKGSLCRCTLWPLLSFPC